MNKITAARIADNGRGLTGKAVYLNSLALVVQWYRFGLAVKQLVCS
jgi:hypothetical protein